MRSRKLSLLLLAGLFGLFLFLWVRSDARGGARASVQESDAAAGDSPVPLATPSLEPERAPVDAEEAPCAAAPEPLAVGEPAREPATVAGRLRVLDEDDRVHDDLDGSFLLTADDETEGRTIEVRAGRFAAELRHGTQYWVELLVAGGRPAVPLEYHHPRRDAAGEWELAARWARATVLTVVAADTGLELSGIDLVDDSSGEGCRPGELEDDDWLARDALSPITLPIPEDAYAGTRLLHARAPGYAWGCVNVPETLGGAYRLALERAGTLEIHVAGHDASLSEARLRLRRPGRPDDDPLVELVLGERSTFLLEALEAGPWVVTLELGHRWRWPQVLARGEVTVRVDAHATLELLVQPVEDPEPAPLAGLIRVSPAWDFHELLLTAELLDAPPRGQAKRFQSLTLAGPQPDDPKVWEWRFDGVQPGRWSVTLTQLGVGLACEVPPRGLTDVELVVPDPVEVRVELRDRGSGHLVPDARLGWMPPRDWADVGGQVLSSEAEGTGTFSFRAPAGTVELWCFSDRHRFVHEVLELRAPRTEHEVLLDPACGFVLRVRHESTLLPWPVTFGYGLEARRLDGEGAAQLHDQDANELEARFQASAPGRYRLELPRIPGYAPIPPQEVLVPQEGFARLDVELVRP